MEPLTGKADALVAEGAVPAPTVTDAVAASPLVIVCVSDYDAVYETLQGASAAPFAGSASDLLRGKALVNLTTGTLDQAYEAAEWAAGRGIDYLDGAIQAGAQHVGTPEALLLYGGSREVFLSHEATLRLLGGENKYLGAEPGLAALYDLAMHGLVYEVWFGYLQTLAMLGADRVDAAAFAPAAATILPAVVQQLTDIAEQVDSGHYSTETFGRLSDHGELAGHVVDARRARGIDGGRPEQVKELVDRRIAEGRDGDGFASLIEEIRPSPA